jgi:hypothetical protein
VEVYVGHFGDGWWCVVMRLRLFGRLCDGVGECVCLMCSETVECCLVDAPLYYTVPIPLYTLFDREEIFYLVFQIMLISRSIHVHRALFCKISWICGASVDV